jgi:hypothetical protein
MDRGKYVSLSVHIIVGIEFVVMILCAVPSVCPYCLSDKRNKSIYFLMILST